MDAGGSGLSISIERTDMEQGRGNHAHERRIPVSRDLAHDQATDDLLMMPEWVAEERDLRMRDMLDSLALEGQLTSEDALTNAVGLSETTGTSGRDRVS